MEEAHSISEQSWRILTPTLRRPGSEIWVSFNPDLETDPTYQRFVLNTPPETRIAKVDWCDNPWFPEELDKDRLHMQRTDPDAYAHIWDGQCRKNSAAQIFAGKWRIGDIPDDVPEGADGPYYGADWGFSQDPTAIVRCYIHAGRLHITHEAYQVGCEIDKLPALFDTIPGIREHTIRADSARPETISYMQRQGFKVVAVDKWPGSIQDGITRMRAFDEIVLHPRCKHLADEFRLYSYKVVS